MPTNVTYTYISNCAGGGHVVLDVSLDGGPQNRFVYTTDDLRAPLSELTPEERERIALALLKLHFRDRTRQQMATELQTAPVTVTV